MAGCRVYLWPVIFCSGLRDDIGQQLILNSPDFVFQYQFAFLESLDLYLIVWRVVRDAGDRVVQIAMLEFQFLKPLKNCLLIFHKITCP